MAVMTVIAQLGVVGPVSSYRTGRFDVLSKLKEQLPYLFRELAFLLPCLSGKGDCPCHGEIIYLYRGYFKTNLVAHFPANQWLRRSGKIEDLDQDIRVIIACNDGMIKCLNLFNILQQTLLLNFMKCVALTLPLPPKGERHSYPCTA
jgi:hypothetical protein